MPCLLWRSGILAGFRIMLSSKDLNVESSVLGMLLIAGFSYLALFLSQCVYSGFLRVGPGWICVPFGWWSRSLHFKWPSALAESGNPPVCCDTRHYAHLVSPAEIKIQDHIGYVLCDCQAVLCGPSYFMKWSLLKTSWTENASTAPGQNKDPIVRSLGFLGLYHFAPLWELSAPLWVND